MKYLDEFGTNWHVQAGDPANWAKNILKARGFELVVLPRKTYVTGELVPPLFLPGDVVQRARLLDSLGALR